MRKFSKEGHQVFIITPAERRLKEKTSLKKLDEATILSVRTLNIQQTNLVEKGLGIMLIASQFLNAYNRFLSEVKFDLILYSTPPITFTSLILRIKKKCNATSYLLLKDIFPQNAVDIGLIRKNGLIHKYFIRKEIELYRASDLIGTMSQANADYLISHNPYLNPGIVEVCPTSIHPARDETPEGLREKIRSLYKIPLDKVVFVFGGNMGRPQGIDFLIEVLNSNKTLNSVFFVIAGSGTEYSKIRNWFRTSEPKNALLLPALPRAEFDSLVQACDVGMIILDRRFTIPNYPSRLLTYLEHKKPVILATDSNTDIGKIAEENNYGFWSLTGNLESFNKHITTMAEDPRLLKRLGFNGYMFLIENYTVDSSYSIIMKHFKGRNFENNGRVSAVSGLNSNS